MSDTGERACHEGHEPRVGYPFAAYLSFVRLLIRLLYSIIYYTIVDEILLVVLQVSRERQEALESF